MWHSLFTFFVLTCLQGQVISQTSLCSSNLKYGGTCVDFRQACPSDSSVYPPFSNYVGCGRVDRKCCANKPGGIMTNPNGIEVSPPLTCGLGSLEPASKILDGTLTSPCDFPFVVSLRVKTENSSELTYTGTTHCCSGTIIDRRWVLTSPVCILSYGNSAKEATSKMLVVAGEYNVAKIDLHPITKTPMEQLIHIRNVHIHPKYMYRTQAELIPFANRTAINSYGVALIELDEPIRGHCSGIACLPTASEAANDCAGYDDCVITGWGYDNDEFRDLKDELLLGNVRLTSRAACEFLSKKLNISNNRPTGTTCQNPRDANTDGCLGDEGGSVLCSNGYNWVVRGILPLNLCSKDHYEIFTTDVATYLPWIESIIAAN